MSAHHSWTYTVLLITVFMVYLNGGVSELICPEVAELHSSVLITCTFSVAADILYITTNGTMAAATCISGKCLSSQTDRFSGTVVNMTHSYLEIKKAQLLDEGSWTCRDTTNNITSNCSLILRKTPSCSMTSYQNTENLTIGDEVTLSIHVEDYYCSGPTDILLQTGHVIEVVVKDQRTEHSITTNSFNSTLNVTKSHIGSLIITHTCNGISQKITCDGIHALLETPPACNITTNKNRQEYEVGENITLVVYVENYNCSQNTGYGLQTGQRMEEFMKRETTISESIKFSSTFTVMESDFGPVYLLLVCNNVSRSVSCEGIRVLNKKQVKTLHDGDGVPYEKLQYNIVLIAGIAAGAVIAVIAIVIVVYVMKKRRKSQKTSEANEDKDNEMTENVNGRSENITLSAFGAYEDIGDVNSTFGSQRAVKESTECNDNMESFQNQGYMSGEELRLERTESWNPHKSEDQPEARPENIYTQVNKNPKPNT